MFDLEIFPSCKYKPSLFVVISQITGPVNSLQFSASDRVHNKLFICLFLISVISLCKRLSCGTDFSRNTGNSNFLFRLIKEKYCSARKCITDRYLLSIFVLSLYPVICTVTGNLCRSVQIHESGIRKSFLPQPELLRRHSLTAEHNLIHMLRYTVFQSFK